MSDIPTPALAPCPFCGGRAALENLSDADSFYVHCVDCEVQQIANYYKHVAPRRWNQRVAVAEAPRVSREAVAEIIRKAIRYVHANNGAYWDGEWLEYHVGKIEAAAFPGEFGKREGRDG